MGEFFSNPENWVALGFLAFIALVGKRAYAFIGSALDQRSAAIKSNLDEALRLREEAQSLLASYQRKQRDAIEETEAIVAHAREEAERQGQQGLEKLETALERRRKLALERISQAEAQALDVVRAKTVDMALDATRDFLSHELKGKQADALIDAAIKDMSGKLH